MSYTDKLDQSRSSVLINAGQHTLKPNSFNNDSFINSEISHNLLQQINDDDQYDQIANYETQYIDQHGQTVNKQSSHIKQKIIKQKKSEENKDSSKIQQDLQSSEIISKQEIKNIKKHFTQKKQAENDKNKVIQFNNDDLVEKMQNQEYRKSSNKKYQNSFEPNHFQRTKKQVKSKTEGPSYITNAHGLKEEDFYKVDYLKKQIKNKNPYKKLNQKPIIKNDGLDQIEDIISQIQGLNKNSQQQIHNPVTKIMPKDDSLGKSSLKYKKTKNMFSFARQDDKKQKNRDILSKLDDLLSNYRFDNKESQEASINQSRDQNQNESKLSRGQKETSRARQKRQKKRIHQSFKPIQNEFYQVNQFQNYQQPDKKKQPIVQKAIHEIKSTVKNKNQSLNKLLSNVIILVIKWQNLPILPIEFNHIFVQLDSYPIHQAFKYVITKINKKLEHYSIFNVSQSQIGLKRKIKNQKQSKTKQNKSQANHYQLMNEQEFATQWEKMYKQKQLDKKLIQQQKQILMEFDIQWYQAIIKHCYGKQLQEITQESTDAIDVTPYLKCLKQIQTSKGQNSNLKKLIIQNKLKFIDSYIQIKKQFIDKCLIVVIPSIINSNEKQTDPQQVSILKQQLKNNHRGGIYFFKNSQNLCILSKNNQKRFDVIQDCTENQRAVKIGDLIILTLKDNEEQTGQNQSSNSKLIEKNEKKTKQKVQIQVKLDQEKESHNLIMKSKNHTSFQVMEKQLKRNDKTVFGQIYDLDQLIKS